MAIVLNEEGTLVKETAKLKKETKVLTKYIIPIEIIAAVILLVLYFIMKNNTYMVIGIFLFFIAFSQKFKSKDNLEDIQRMKYGQSGEAFVLKQFKKRLPDNFIVLNDVNIKALKKTSQIDHLIITKKTIFVVETKNYAGVLSCDAKDLTIKQDKRGKIKHISNPVSQNEHHCSVLKEFLETKKIPFEEKQIVSVIIMANARVKWNITNLDVFVGKTGSAVNYILNYDSGIEFEDADLRKIISLVLPEYNPENLQF